MLVGNVVRHIFSHQPCCSPRTVSEGGVNVLLAMHPSCKLDMPQFEIFISWLRLQSSSNSSRTRVHKICCSTPPPHFQNKETVSLEDMAAPERADPATALSEKAAPEMASPRRGWGFWVNNSWCSRLDFSHVIKPQVLILLKAIMTSMAVLSLLRA